MKSYFDLLIFHDANLIELLPSPAIHISKECSFTLSSERLRRRRTSSTDRIPTRYGRRPARKRNSSSTYMCWRAPTSICGLMPSPRCTQKNQNSTYLDLSKNKRIIIEFWWSWFHSKMIFCIRIFTVFIGLLCLWIYIFGWNQGPIRTAISFSDPMIISQQ